MTDIQAQGMKIIALSLVFLFVATEADAQGCAGIDAKGERVSLPCRFPVFLERHGNLNVLVTQDGEIISTMPAEMCLLEREGELVVVRCKPAAR